MKVDAKCKYLCFAACLLWAMPLAAEQPPRVEIMTAHRIGTTPPMRDYLATHHSVPNAPFRVFPLRKSGPSPGHKGGSGSSWQDLALQTSPLTVSNIYPGNEFDGLSADGYVPPDTNISVGNGQIVETVNVNYGVFNTSGNLLQAVAPIHSIFAAASNLPSGDMCASVDGGDPIVLYDQIDQRWIISQLAYNNGLNNNHFCLAISTSSNATGAYAAYDLAFGKNFPDYPKLGIWTTGTKWNTTSAQAGVYLSANIYSHGNTYAGAEMCGFRLADVAALPSSIQWVCTQTGSSVFSVLPAELEGSPGVSGTSNPAPAGTGEYYLEFTGSNSLQLFQFTPNFKAKTATLSGPTTITVKAFHEACGGGACIPQDGTNEPLDSLGDRLMYPLSYRNYGSGGQSMTVTQSVQISSASNQTGVRWYQLTNKGSGWTASQQGTFGPTDGDYRWMGSIAQDKAGDLGIGYSVSSPNMFPNIAYSGWVPGDAPDNLERENLLNVGLGSQTSVNRWGDYSSMSIDPGDDCTFWYANEYLKSNGSYTNWGTYIASFKIYTSGSACHE